MSINFIRISNYNFEEDGPRVLGYASEDEKFDFRKFRLYTFDGTAWTKLNKRNAWEPSPAPYWFSSIPNIRRVNYRVPTPSQIEQLTREQALEILKRDPDFNERLIQVVQRSLKEKFYND